MSRPLITPEQLAAQHRQARVIERAWGWRLHPMPTFSPYDYTAENEAGQVCGIVELKGKGCRAGQYPAALVDIHKVVSLLEFGALFDVPAVLAVAFTDEIRWVDVATLPDVPLGVAGRADRGRASDRRPVMHIPLELMGVVGTGDD